MVAELYWRGSTMNRIHTPRTTPVLVGLILITVVLVGCSEHDDRQLVGPDKVSIGTEPDPGGLVDTRILDGENDPLAPGDDQLYPYYVVHHGPAAGVYPFESGDTVPDGAYVVFKALATSQEPAPQKLHVQGRFEASALYMEGPLFNFGTTFSTAYLNAGWRDDAAASDTVGFEVGPFDYTVSMRGVLFQGGEVTARDDSPAEFTFFGNRSPCVQCIELGNLEVAPAALYDDLAGDNCADPACLGEAAELSLFMTGDSRYDRSDPAQIIPRGFAAENGTIFVNPASGQIRFDEPPYGDWVSIPSTEYQMMVYLHGKDPVDEPARPGRPWERIKAWRYQVDYAGDPENAIADGVGHDNIGLPTSFNIHDNEDDPMASDLFVMEETGVWGLVVKVAVPVLLQVGGAEAHWAYLTSAGLQCPPYPEGGSEAEILAWQDEPSVQDALQVWRLTTAQFTEGSIRAVALDHAACESNHEVGRYHFYDGTRLPADDDMHGRSCEEGAYDHNDEGITELGALFLDRYHAFRPHQESSRSFRIDVFQVGEDEPLDLAAPPGWIATRGEPARELRRVTAGR